MLALAKESSAIAEMTASKSDAQPKSREQEQTLEEFTRPEYSWNIGNIAMSAPVTGAVSTKART